MQTSLIRSELHDFSPKQDFQTRVRKWKILIAVIYLFLGILFILTTSTTLSSTSRTWMRPVFITLFLLLIPVSLYALLLIKTGALATNWDDMDYSGLTKRDLDFTTSDGVHHFAYIYYPSSLDLESLKTPLPTIIGFHGWGSHHREMDRYCLPSVRSHGYLYFTFDAYGQGQTPGDKNDLTQIDHAREFIDLVYSIPFVDKSQIVVVGMSLGAAKAAVVAYPNPKVKGVVLLSGPYNLVHTQKFMTWGERLLFLIGGFKLSTDQEILKKYSGIEYFRAEGVQLEGEDTVTPNSERVFLLANCDDPTVRVKSTLEAIEKLHLPPSNYRLYPHGRHCFEGNEYYVALDIEGFIQRLLS